MMKTNLIFKFAAPMAGVAAVASILAYGGSPNGADAARDQPDGSEFAASIPEFQEPVASEDRLPSFMSTGEGAATELVLESSRLIGEMDGARHWVVESRAGEACLVIVLAQSPETASMSCGTEEDLYDHGVALQVANDAQRVRTYLIPDGYDMDVPGLESLGDRLLVDDASSAAPEIVLQSDPSSEAERLDGASSEFADEVTLPAMEKMRLVP